MPPYSVSPPERGQREWQEAAEEVESLSPIDGNVKMKGRGEEGVGRILRWHHLCNNTVGFLCLQMGRDNALVYEGGESVRHCHGRTNNADCLFDIVYD